MRKALAMMKQWLKPNRCMFDTVRRIENAFFGCKSSTVLSVLTTGNQGKIEMIQPAKSGRDLTKL